MSKLTLTTQKKLLATAVIVTLGGVTAAVSAAPTLMGATAVVQSAVAINETTPLSFGTVFATNSTATSVNTPATVAALANKLVLSPTVTGANTVTEWSGGTSATPILPLGGTPAAGVYTIPGLPASSNIAILLTTATGVSVRNSTTTADAYCGYEDWDAAEADGKITLNVAAGNPVATAFFCLDALEAVDTTAAPIVISDGTLLPTSTAAGVITVASGYPLPFGNTSLKFNLGGTLVQQSPTTGAVRNYEPVTYTGQFGMEVVFK